MFQEAYKKASRYTFPVVISRKTVAGDCYASMGTFIVLNRDGWILTADHIIGGFLQMSKEADDVESWLKQKVDIENDTSINASLKKKRLRKLNQPKSEATEKSSIWWNHNDWTVSAFLEFPLGDLAVGKIDNFDPKLVPNYPIFKNPKADFIPGVSLCKLGYPFHSITPIWDDAGSTFLLPPESLPLPRFPIEGLLTRFLIKNAQGSDSPPFDVVFIETSSPGLRGQSGGPIFDKEAHIWGLQSATRHYPLGFDPVVPGSRKKEKEHQFLNVGIGARSDTILHFLDDRGIEYQVSS